MKATLLRRDDISGKKFYVKLEPENKAEQIIFRLWNQGLKPKFDSTSYVGGKCESYTIEMGEVKKETLKTFEKDFDDYCKLVADKIKEHQKEKSFLTHFAKHMSETIAHCLNPAIPTKRKLVSIINFVYICAHLNGETISSNDCIKALMNYHSRPGVFSVGQNGDVKMGD